MGTEYSFEVLREMYRYLSSRESFEFREYTKADTIEIENGRAVGVWLIGRDGERRLEKARYIVAAPGRGRRGMAHLHRPGKQPANHQQRRGYRRTGGSAQCRDGPPDQKTCMRRSWYITQIPLRIRSAPSA